jgi:hypothetical protein
VSPASSGCALPPNRLWGVRGPSDPRLARSSALWHNAPTLCDFRRQSGVCETARYSDLEPGRPTNLRDDRDQ